MDKVTVMAVLGILADMQKDTSPINLSIGNVTKGGTVQTDVIVIHEAPPIVLKEIVNTCGYRASLEKEGIVITCDKEV